jgi:hypothetical protein
MKHTENSDRSKTKVHGTRAMVSWTINMEVGVLA